jgi:AraC-like DNA-binding protein
MSGSAALSSPAPGLLHGSRRSVPKTLRLTVNDAPEHERLELHREFFQRQGVRYGSAATGTEPIGIDLTLHRLPGLQFSSGTLQGARFHRTRESSEPTEDVGLMINREGEFLISQRGRDIALDAGEATLVSLTETLDTVHRGDILILRFPRPQLAPRLAAAEDCELRRIPSGTPALRLLIDYAKLVEQEDVDTSEDLHHVMGPHFYDLAAVAIGATREATELAQGSGLRAARLYAIKNDIGRNLDDTDLSVTTLAGRHGCTPRCIQRLFEQEGTSFTDYLLKQRLARAYCLLTDRRHADLKITAIAFDVGFGDMSYFNRTFRRHYGDTPSGVRALVRRSCHGQA